tara:strand:+ start:1325 stop:3610 length:2286 start_codon:yes stop_codon:yes gene_type:complete
MGFSLKNTPGLTSAGKDETPKVEVDDSETTITEKVTDVLESVKNIPGAISDMVTGEDAELEFPDAPETTEIDDIGFFETLVPNAKLMLVRDDNAKAEIIAGSFKGDKRFGGVFSDKFDNPLIIWNDKPYYVNKPGVSTQDIGTVIGEVAKYFPASKFAGKAATTLSKVGRGIPSYAATETVSQLGEAQLAPKTAEAQKKGIGDIAGQSAEMAAISTGTDIALPPILRGLKAAGKAVARPIAKATQSAFPRYVPEKLIQALKSEPKQVSPYPLTQGQRTAEIPEGPTPKDTPQLQEEDVLRRSPATDVDAAAVIRGFDEKQLDQIRTDSKQLQDEFGSGDISVTSQIDVPGAASEKIQSIVSGRADAIKSEASAGYKAVRDAPSATIMSPEGVVITARRAIDDILGTGENSMRIAASELVDMPKLAREINFLKKAVKVFGGGKARNMPLQALHGYQKRLSRAIGDSDIGSAQRTALTRMKRIIDDSIYDGIEQGIVRGDEAVLQQLKSATNLYKQYMGLTGKGSAGTSPQKAANKILEKLTDKDFTPQQIVNSLFGHTRFNPDQSIKIVLKKLKQGLPEEEYGEVIALLKDGILEKAFAGTGKSGVTRTNIVNNFNNIFEKQKTIINEIFSPAEIKKISEFRENVMPTLWAEIKMNPSGTSYTLLGAMARQGLLSYAKMLPLASEVIRAGEKQVDIRKAFNATRQYLIRKGSPLLPQVTSAYLRDISQEVGEEVDLKEKPAVSRIIKSLTPTTRKKLDQIGK